MKFLVVFKQRRIINEKINPIIIIKKRFTKLIFSKSIFTKARDINTNMLNIISNITEADPSFKERFFCFFKYNVLTNSPSFIGNKSLKE